FYSPNCNRAVDIPLQSLYAPDPFKHGRLNVSMFKQPVWWSQSWAWMSFIPLAPSFLFTPFEPLCAMPRIEETEIRFRMAEDDIERWIKEEERIVKLAHVIKLRYGISGVPPPKPSSFHFDRAHKSHPIAKRMICLAREWFTIWMGYAAYLIAKTRLHVPNGEPDHSMPRPDWYNHLRNQHQFHESWLDGLLLSTVCAFEPKTPRAGIVFQWTDGDRLREPIEWFHDHSISLWFVWSNKEEQAISGNPSLAHLRPPDALIQDALTLLFSIPSLPLAGLVLQQYYLLGNDPATADAGLKNLKVSRDNEILTAAQTASSFPYHGLLTIPGEPGRLYNHYDDFFAARERRQKELMKLESFQDRQKRESRARNLGITNATIYIWEKTRSSGGLELYKRVQVNKKANEDAYYDFRPHQRLFNAFDNEWDLCEDFCFGPEDYSDADSDDKSYDDDDNYPNDFVSQPSHPPPLAVPTDIELDSTQLHSQDPFETMSLVYGYVPRLGASNPPSAYKWEGILNFMGFVDESKFLDIAKPEKSEMLNHFSAVVAKIGSEKTDELIAQNFEVLKGLFAFEHVQRPSEDLFADFDVAMLACQSVLTSPQGRAALLRGGIIGRIAKKYLSMDGVLDGPSIEVTAHRMGYLAPSGDNHTRFCDDQLTDNEIAIICGTYSLYTAIQGQVAVRSWFPPPAAWEHNRSGCKWLEWTERSEEIFQNILKDVRCGTAQPKSLSDWISQLRGQNVSRVLLKQNNSRSKQFMDTVVPIGQCN
ncbi:hypothetical protein GALMADRAFT_67036, partial [Galerina marginata CBS 339.88]